MKPLTRLLALLTFSVTAAIAAPVKPAEPAKISRGEAVVISDLLVPGKTVIFDFTSAYCPPCRAYDEPLHRLHTSRADIVVIKIDINRPDVKGIDWKSPVAKQFGLISIPQFKIYGPDGKLIAEDKIALGADGKAKRDQPARQLVDQWIEAAKS